MNSIDRNVYGIIVTYNAMKWVDRCLGSLRESSVPISPVIIDNCSNDDTVEYVKKHYPEAYVIENAENRGFGQANNQGIEYAYRQGATHFFLLNQDAWVTGNTIEVLVNTIEDNQLSIVAPVQLNGQGTSIDKSYFDFFVTRNNNIGLVSDIYLGTRKMYYPIPYINAAAWMISRNTIEVIGGFDPVFFQYGEDNNYCQRLAFHKRLIAVVLGAVVFHDREYKGNQTMYEKNYILNNLIDISANITRPYFKVDRIQLSVYVYAIKSFFRSLIHLNFKEIMNILKNFIEYFKRIKVIKYSRMQNKTIGSNWLDL